MEDIDRRGDVVVKEDGCRGIDIMNMIELIRLYIYMCVYYILSVSFPFLSFPFLSAF